MNERTNGEELPELSGGIELGAGIIGADALLQLREVAKLLGGVLSGVGGSRGSGGFGVALAALLLEAHLSLRLADLHRLVLALAALLIVVGNALEILLPLLLLPARPQAHLCVHCARAASVSCHSYLLPLPPFPPSLPSLLTCSSPRSARASI